MTNLSHHLRVLIFVVGVFGLAMLHSCGSGGSDVSNEALNNPLSADAQLEKVQAELPAIQFERAIHDFGPFAKEMWWPRPSNSRILARKISSYKRRVVLVDAQCLFSPKPQLHPVRRMKFGWNSIQRVRVDFKTKA